MQNVFKHYRALCLCWGLACTLLLLPLAAAAWGAQGHRIVGEMAEELLDKKAQQKINAVLGGASIAMVSNWGDEVRSDANYSHTSKWHYTNLDSGLSRAAFDAVALQQTNGECIYRIVALASHLQQNPNDTAMLKMFIHLVEDMHCPMHLGRAADRGANSIRIKWFGRNTNLHSLWDSELIDGLKLSYTEYAAHLTRVNRLQKIAYDGQSATVLNWAWQVYGKTQQVYASQGATGKHYEYIYAYKPLWESSLVKGAEHLAALLNYIYK
ncbi:endonuclease [Bacteroidia bacterium]|nr:endonuclease [Bacteroidia bacterium]